MTQAKKGDRVKVHYTGKLTDGTVFDSSEGKDPLEFVLGAGNVIEGFDEAVTGLSIGESRNVSISPDKAYGEHFEKLVMEVQKKDLPTDMDFQIGQQLHVNQGENQAIVVWVTGVTDTTLTLDANHQLAGKELVFDVKLVEIL